MIPNIAIIGAGRIGRTHAHLLERVGGTVTSVLNSNAVSTRQATNRLTAELGHSVTPLNSLDELIARQPHGVCVASPPEFHYDPIMRLLHAGIPVFAEKPLFWENDLAVEDVRERLNRISAVAPRRLLVNTSNTALLDAVCDELPPPSLVKTFEFHFYTHGPYRGNAIAFDLIPHALSLLIHHIGGEPMAEYVAKWNEHTFNCSFNYGSVGVSLRFQEDSRTPKAFGFSINGVAYERVQEGTGSSYCVFMQNTATGIRFESPDPFTVYLGEFVQLCKGQETPDRWESIKSNMMLMTQCLLDQQGSN